MGESKKVFLSYSHDDKEWVRHFANDLRYQVSYLDITIWCDEGQINPADSIREALGDAIRQSDVIIAILSRNKSNWANVFFELGVALGMGKRLIYIVHIEPEIQFSLSGKESPIRQYLIKGSPFETAREVAAILIA